MKHITPILFTHLSAMTLCHPVSHKQPRVRSTRGLTYRQRWAIGGLVLCGLAVVNDAQAVALVVESGSGDNFWELASGTSVTTHPTATSSGGTGGWAFRWNVAPVAQGSPNLCSGTTGYVAQSGVIKAGVKIAQGIILHFTSGSLTNTVSLTVPTSSSQPGSATLQADGTMTNPTNSVASYTQVLCTSLPTGTAVTQGAETNTQLTGGRLYVYVDETALPGTYTVPALNLVVDHKSAAKTQISQGGTLTVIKKATCTVSIPAAVNFGSIPNRIDMVTESGQINVGCEGGTGQTKVNYRAMPTIPAVGAKQYMPMFNQTSKSEVATIRAFLGPTGAATAACIDAGNSMQMDGSSQSLGTVPLNGSIEQQVTWTLCPVPDPEPGPATASMSFEIDW